MIDYDILQTTLSKAMDIEIREAEEYLKDRSYAPTPEFEEVMQKLLSDQKKGDVKSKLECYMPLKRHSSK